MTLTRKVLTFILPYKKLIIAAIFSSIIYAFANGLAIWMSASFIETIFIDKEEVGVQQSSGDAAAGKRPDLNEYLKSKTRAFVYRERKEDILRVVCLVILIAFLIKNIAGYAKGLQLTMVNIHTVNNIRNTLYEHLQKLSIGYFEKRKGGEITSILVNDVGVLSTTLSGSCEKLIMTPIQIIMFVVILFIISWKLSLMVFVLVPLMGLVISQIGQSIRRKSRRTYEQTAVFISILQETVAALRIVKAFAMENEEIARFREALKKYFGLLMRQRSLQMLGSPINEMLGVFAAIALLLYGGSQVLKGGGMEPVDFVKYIFLLFATFQPLKDLTGLNNQLQAGFAAAERIFTILETPPEITDAADALTVTDFKEAIEVKDVWFRYDDAGPFVLKNINLRINRGEIVALVGQSGAGKSTLVDLIPRFYDAVRGEISVDGMNIRRIKNYSLKKLFGIVTQETILFNNSLSFNIAYGSATVDQEVIIKAAKVANAHDFIMEFDEGYGAIVGDRGVKLSGGQRQRIAIARAILQNPPILILDEATSSLDTESERYVQEAIDTLMQNRTVIVIAHRLSTIIHADKIVVMNKGEIVAIGSHRELLKKSPLYRHLYEIQFRDERSDQ